MDQDVGLIFRYLFASFFYRNRWKIYSKYLSVIIYAIYRTNYWSIFHDFFSYLLFSYFIEPGVGLKCIFCTIYRNCRRYIFLLHICIYVRFFIAPNTDLYLLFFTDSNITEYIGPEVGTFSGICLYIL